jgi:DNA-binding response OmpR family regulator
VALTAWPEEVARTMVEAYNLDGYIGKPFNMHDLIKLVDDLLAR